VTIRGSCSCNNISVFWKNFDFSLVPRKCGCDFCCSRGAAYVSKSGTVVEATIAKRHLHNVVEHGSMQAKFHECAFCRDIVMVTAVIQGTLYGALNVNCLHSRERFVAPVIVDFSGQTPEEKLERWRRNWCHPVSITSHTGAGRADGMTA
jgi:hypothetical protein